MRALYFFGFTVSTALGVAFETVFSFGYPFGIFCAFLGIVLLLLRGDSSHRSSRFFVSLLFLGCALGVFRVDVSHLNRNVHTLDQFSGSVVGARGVIVEEPDVRESYANITLNTKSLSLRGLQKNLEMPVRVLVRVPAYPLLAYGDEIVATGKIEIPKNFVGSPDERPFDYRAYLAKDDIHYTMSFSKIDILGHEKGNPILGTLLNVKQKLMANIARVMREPEASLGGGIILGAKQSLGTEWIEKFRASGLAHIVVLSGYNIAVVATVIAQVLVFLPFTARLVASGFGIVLFALMVGGGVTVLRATLMALVVTLARILGRESEGLRVLLFVGWLMVLLNPLILLSDVSFQLSFMAALALVILAPRVEHYFLFIKKGMLREIVVTTIATQLFVAPILLYHMGTFSLVGLVANIFVLPIVPLAMLMVSFVAVLAPIPFLGILAALPARVLLSYILYIVDIGARIPFASIELASFGIVPVVISYAILFFVCTRVKQKENAK